MTEDQYGNLKESIGELRTGQKNTEKKLDAIQLNQIAMSFKLDEANGGLKRHLNNHRLGGNIIIWGGIISGVISVLWEVLG